MQERPKLIVRAKGKAQGRGIGSSIGSQRGINGIPRVNIPHIPPEFLHHLSETESESKRPLTPSVHRPVVHIPSVERIASDGNNSERTKSTINSSEGIAVDPDRTIRFKDQGFSSNPFDD